MHHGRRIHRHNDDNVLLVVDHADCNHLNWYSTCGVDGGDVGERDDPEDGRGAPDSGEESCGEEGCGKACPEQSGLEGPSSQAAAGQGWSRPQNGRHSAAGETGPAHAAPEVAGSSLRNHWLSMNITVSARCRGLVIVGSALLVLAIAGAASASPSAADGSQRLVTVLAVHRVHVEPSATSAVFAVVARLTPITAIPTTLPVLEQRGSWLLVRLPGRPNGHAGWIDTAHTSRSVTFWHIFVNTARRTVTVEWGGRAVRIFQAVVGKPSTPTPVGQFFVEEPVALGPAGIGAPFALALSARSNVLQDFDGGPGQIAIHGLENVGGTPGTAASHGCIRVANTNARWLAARIGAGVPVTVTR